MPKEEIVDYMASANIRQKVQLQIIMQAAPFFKRLKKSNISMINKTDFEEVLEIIENTDISIFNLYENSSKVLVFLYREEEFQQYFEDKDIQDFLKDFGYESFEVNSMLKILSQRFADYYSDRKKFPHELGVFLGYPLEDVNGFIQNNGENFLISGYWKVYQNVSGAKRIFKEYDNAKENAVIEFLSGRNFKEIVV